MMVGVGRQDACGTAKDRGTQVGPPARPPAVLSELATDSLPSATSQLFAFPSMVQSYLGKSMLFILLLLP